MDRVFLDANVLFSAAWQPNVGLLRLWKLKNVTLCSSHYAVEEANVNLDTDTQRSRLRRLATHIVLVDSPARKLPEGIALPEKDIPILLAAIEAKATHLLTGDIRHFGAYFGRRIAGILVQLPGDYLRIAK